MNIDGWEVYNGVNFTAYNLIGFHEQLGKLLSLKKCINKSFDSRQDTGLSEADRQHCIAISMPWKAFIIKFIPSPQTFPARFECSNEAQIKLRNGRRQLLFQLQILLQISSLTPEERFKSLNVLLSQSVYKENNRNKTMGANLPILFSPRGGFVVYL